MKNLILTITLIASAAMLQGMELNNTLTYSVNRTKIYLTKGNIYDLDGKVKIMVIGVRQQRNLQPSDFGDSYSVGTTLESKTNIVNVKNKDTESASDDDTYKPYNAKTINKKKLWLYTHDIKLQSVKVGIVEPRIYYEEGVNPDEYWSNDNYVSQTDYKYCPKNEPSNECWGNDAIAKAGKDLEFCYNNVLDKACTLFTKQEIKNNAEKSIALPTLSTSLGFPRKNAAPFAVVAVLNFITKNPTAYDAVHLVVKKRSELDLYKTLLDKLFTEQT